MAVIKHWRRAIAALLVAGPSSAAPAPRPRGLEVRGREPTSAIIRAGRSSSTPGPACTPARRPRARESARAPSSGAPSRPGSDRRMISAETGPDLLTALRIAHPEWRPLLALIEEALREVERPEWRDSVPLDPVSAPRAGAAAVESGARGRVEADRAVGSPGAGDRGRGGTGGALRRRGHREPDRPAVPVPGRGVPGRGAPRRHLASRRRHARDPRGARSADRDAAAPGLPASLGGRRHRRRGRTATARPAARGPPWPRSAASTAAGISGAGAVAETGRPSGSSARSAASATTRSLARSCRRAASSATGSRSAIAAAGTSRPP